MKKPDSTPDSRHRSRLEVRLLAAARRRPLDERVPIGFSRRVQSHLRAGPVAGDGGAWRRGFWPALIPAGACLAWVLWLQPQQPPVGTLSEADLDVEAAAISLLDVLDVASGEVEL